MEKDLDRGRYTSQDAAQKLGNLYDLILVGSARARELKKEKHGSSAKSQILVALAEIEDGKIGKEYIKEYMKETNKKHRPKWSTTG